MYIFYPIWQKNYLVYGTGYRVLGLKLRVSSLLTPIFHCGCMFNS